MTEVPNLPALYLGCKFNGSAPVFWPLPTIHPCAGSFPLSWECSAPPWFAPRGGSGGRTWRWWQKERRWDPPGNGDTGW